MKQLTSVVTIVDRLSLFLNADRRSVSALLVPPDPNAPVLLLHQLLETVEQRERSVPGLADDSRGNNDGKLRREGCKQVHLFVSLYIRSKPTW